MEAVGYAHSAKQAKRIKRFIENPDSNSGVLTQPKVIGAGETVTIKSGRQAILADTVVDGDLVIEAGGEVFVPSGAGFGDLESQINDRYTKTEVDNKPSGTKNLLINGNKTIRQRGVTGGRKQVVLNTANLGGNHTISFTGTATVTIKEATTLGASDALTTWDTALVTGGVSGTTVTLTANKWIHVEFSTTDWNFAQLEKGDVHTNFEYRHNELEICQSYFEKTFTTSHGVVVSGVGPDHILIPLKTTKISIPLAVWVSNGGIDGSLGSTGTTTGINFSLNNETELLIRPFYTGTFNTANEFVIFSSGIIWANSEIFNADDGIGINYKEDRWYV